jgi:cysteine desulfurase
MKRGLIYLDYAATTPVDQRVLDAMYPYFCEVFSNPSSKHTCGRKAAKAVEDSRKMMADLLGARSPSEIVFTSGASEANNLAIKGFAERFEDPRHFITTSIEHKAALKAMSDLEEWGHRITVVQPGPDGVVNPRDILEAISDDTVLVSCMLVNNEIGTIQPIDDIADICHAHGIAFHCDATQGFGKLPVRVGSNIDMLSLSAHKFYGPKGVGALYVADEMDIKCQISGGSQENGRRSGTLNVPGIVGMAEAAKISCGRMAEEWDRLKGLEQIFLGLVRKTIPMAYLQGNADYKVPWINNICFNGADAGRIRDALGRREICVSRTSACAKSGAKSHVLEAIGTNEALVSGAVRFSFGSRTTEKKIRTAAAELRDVVAKLRAKDI